MIAGEKIGSISSSGGKMLLNCKVMKLQGFRCVSPGIDPQTFAYGSLGMTADSVSCDANNLDALARDSQRPTSFTGNDEAWNFKLNG